MTNRFVCRIAFASSNFPHRKTRGKSAKYNSLWILHTIFPIRQFITHYAIHGIIELFSRVYLTVDSRQLTVNIVLGWVWFVWYVNWPNTYSEYAIEMPKLHTHLYPKSNSYRKMACRGLIVEIWLGNAIRFGLTCEFATFVLFRIR